MSQHPDRKRQDLRLIFFISHKITKKH